MIGMFSALAGILYCFDFALPMISPPFYKLDFSELPALIAGFAFGPVAGVLVEFPSSELVKLVGSREHRPAFVRRPGQLSDRMHAGPLPASIIYQFKKIPPLPSWGCVVGTVIMTVFGTWFNVVYLLPAFSELFGMPMETILEMGKAIQRRCQRPDHFRDLHGGAH